MCEVVYIIIILFLSFYFNSISSSLNAGDARTLLMLCSYMDGGDQLPSDDPPVTFLPFFYYLTLHITNRLLDLN